MPPDSCGVLLLPALISLALIPIGRALYPNPVDLEVRRLEVHGRGLPVCGGDLVGRSASRQPYVKRFQAAQALAPGVPSPH